jgi:hypothetical protein
VPGLTREIGNGLPVHLVPFWEHWRLWQEVCRDAGFPYDPQELEMVARDAGQVLGFVHLVGRKRD